MKRLFSPFVPHHLHVFSTCDDGGVFTLLTASRSQDVTACHSMAPCPELQVTDADVFPFGFYIKVSKEKRHTSLLEIKN